MTGELVVEGGEAARFIGLSVCGSRSQAKDHARYGERTGEAELGAFTPLSDRGFGRKSKKIAFKISSNSLSL